LVVLFIGLKTTTSKVEMLSTYFVMLRKHLND